MKSVTPIVRIDTARIIGEDVREDIFLHNVSGIFTGERGRSKVGGSRGSFYKRDEDKSHQLTVGNGRRKIAGFLCNSRFFEKLFSDCKATESQKKIKGEITPERISENRKKSIDMLLKDGSLTNQAKLALYAGWHEYHGTEMEDLLNYAGDYGLKAEYVIRLGILMTMVDFRTVYAKDIFTKVKEVYGNTIGTFKAFIPMSVKAAETSAEGKSIFEHCGKGKVAIAYEALTKEVLHNED